MRGSPDVVVGFLPLGNTEHNLETSGVSRSEHFRIAAALLGVNPPLFCQCDAEVLFGGVFLMLQYFLCRCANLHWPPV